MKKSPPTILQMLSPRFSFSTSHKNSQIALKMTFTAFCAIYVFLKRVRHFPELRDKCQVMVGFTFDAPTVCYWRMSCLCIRRGDFVFAAFSARPPWSLGFRISGKYAHNIGARVCAQQQQHEIRHPRHCTIVPS